MPINIEKHLISDEIISELSENNSKNSIIDIIEVLKDYELSYIESYLLTSKKEQYKLPNILAGGVLNIILEQLFITAQDIEDTINPFISAKIFLLGYLIAKEADVNAYKFWERAILNVRKIGGCFQGRHFYYKIMGDIIDQEIRRARNKESQIKIIAFTPLFLLPSERSSLARIYAYEKLQSYLKIKGDIKLKMLFCDSSTRLEIEKMNEQEINEIIISTNKYTEDNSNVKLRYFHEAYGLPSTFLGVEAGVIQDGAEVYHIQSKAEGKVIVRQIVGPILDDENIFFDKCFDESNGTNINSFKIDTKYLESWSNDLDEYLFSRNKGVYSSNELDKLKNKKVAIIGLGCVGGSVAQMLTRIGIRSLILVDHDKFEIENINRQPYATLNTVGQMKTTATINELKKINPKIKPINYDTSFNLENANEIIEMADIVVQSVDDMKTRILIHRIGKKYNKPVVTMTGQPPYRGFVSTFFSDSPEYEKILGFGSKVTELTNEELISNDNKILFDELKQNRAKKSLENSGDKNKIGILNNWYEGFSKGNNIWAVTFERTWIMAVLQAHEVTRFITGGREKMLAIAPKAIIIDLMDAPNIVRIAEPSSEEKWASENNWNYENF